MDDSDFKRKVWIFAHGIGKDSELFKTIIGEHHRRVLDKTKRSYPDSLEACFIRECLYPKDKVDLREFYRKLVLKINAEI